MNNTITMTKTSYRLKDGTKTVFKQYETETKTITKEQMQNIISSSPFFRKLGGTETLTRDYTCAGYVPISLISKNPERTEKIIRTFKYE